MASTHYTISARDDNNFRMFSLTEVREGVIERYTVFNTLAELFKEAERKVNEHIENGTEYTVTKTGLAVYFDELREFI